MINEDFCEANQVANRTCWFDNDPEWRRALIKFNIQSSAFQYSWSPGTPVRRTVQGSPPERILLKLAVI